MVPSMKGAYLDDLDDSIDAILESRFKSKI
jgi:hypothetical protein